MIMDGGLIELSPHEQYLRVAAKHGIALCQKHEVRRKALEC